jgi:hypothetical protein
VTDRRRLTGQGVRISVDEHRATRAIEAAATSAAWINAALVQCQKDVDLARAALAAENDKGAVTCAYDAIRTAVECHMNAAGLRISNQPGAHKVAIDYAAEKMAGVFDETRLLQYEQLRVLRHRCRVPVLVKHAAVDRPEGFRRRRGPGGGDGQRRDRCMVARGEVASLRKAPNG